MCVDMISASNHLPAETSKGFSIIKISVERQLMSGSGSGSSIFVEKCVLDFFFFVCLFYYLMLIASDYLAFS